MGGDNLYKALARIDDQVFMYFVLLVIKVHSFDPLTFDIASARAIVVVVCHLVWKHPPMRGQPLNLQVIICHL